MAEYLYCRVSTDGQSVDPQTQMLTKKYPGAQIVSEIASGAKARPMLKALVEQLQRGDVLIIAALDRLGRKTTEILTLIEELTDRGVILRSEREFIDFASPIGKMVTAILASMAELERSMISDRTKAGIESARAKGKIIGRPRTISDCTIRAGIGLVREKGMTITEAAKKVGVSYPVLAMALRTK
ncbi:MAG TPA: recombinase family protein [Oligoflexus sp.]|uniref:recombinase family protein n=1 Tax=Oligoflexus sp. TaxID=1971216 RepID=UPI002D2319B9|nr:recombinase family protein [Oligoflexus sp.]HYX34123.1 recombinase family protein [Oligoflexus sp.]